MAECYADPYGFVLQAYDWPIKGEPGPDPWQQSILEEIGHEVECRGFDGIHAVDPIREAWSTGHGVGKAQPLSLEFHTPTGLQRWGDLQVGDEVFGADGRPIRIVAIHDRGVLPVFRVTFDDGSSTRVCGEHLWLVKGRAQRRYHNKRRWILKTTQQLLALGVKRANGVAVARQWEIPIQGPVQFVTRQLPIAPYVLGAWLGDGCRMSASLTTADMEIPSHIQSLGEQVWLVQGLSWRVRGLRRRLRHLGILDRYSYQKSVPRAYLETSVEHRAELLRGLLDTDGECDRSGHIIFSSTSHALACDVVWLVRSLGGKAQFQPTIKHPTFRGPNGQRKAGRACWRVTMRLPNGFQPFYVQRKQARMILDVEHRYLTRWIDRIESDGEEGCRCITVDDPLGLYQTNDFIITHNSSLFAWLTDWLMSTRRNARGTITANTNDQLKGKTWAAVREWTKLCLTAHWFEINDAIMYRVGARESWFCKPQTCAPENSEAFAGQHAKDSSSFYIFDEASGIHRKIWEVAEGGLTDGEPFFFVGGNPTENTGAFHEAVFGLKRDRWKTHILDARASKFSNKRLQAEWAADYGEDSDFFRVRVRGLPPQANELQFIDPGLVRGAQQRQVNPLSDEPLIAGVDVSGGGSAWTVVRFRRGSDGRSREPIRIPGSQSKLEDRPALVAKLASVLRESAADRKVAAMFVDGAYGAPLVERLKALGFTTVHEVNFGGSSPDQYSGNQRAYQWQAMKEWLARGAIPKDDIRLASDLVGPGFHRMTKSQALILESKESMAARGVASPDDGDALSLTFAQPVAIGVREEGFSFRPPPVASPHGWTR